MSDFNTTDNTKAKGGGKWVIRKSGNVGSSEDNKRERQIKTVGHLATQSMLEKNNTPTSDGYTTNKVK
jgi:hypothetical protein